MRENSPKDALCSSAVEGTTRWATSPSSSSSRRHCLVGEIGADTQRVPSRSFTAVMRMLVDTENRAMHCSKPHIRPGTSSVRSVSLYGAGARIVPAAEYRSSAARNAESAPTARAATAIAPTSPRRATSATSSSVLPAVMPAARQATRTWAQEPAATREEHVRTRRDTPALKCVKVGVRQAPTSAAVPNAIALGSAARPPYASEVRANLGPGRDDGCESPSGKACG
mmetsp:Transcript_126912/g.353393  ORF Transcript_126912/g.353393 Transcript_126912/m.353393 type:complete len:226 (+) Transcript_126912:693-1370(+)